MATVTGSVGGQDVSVTNSSAAAADLANALLNSSNTQALTSGGVVQGNYFASTGAGIISGSQSVTIGLLAGNGAAFVTGASQASEVVAGDNTNSTIVNNNANGSLIAFTGVGPNAVVGSGLINGLQTAAGGQDVVLLSGSSNLVNSYGNDAILFQGNAGPQANEVIANDGAVDNITLNNGASLAFINMSSGTSSITASAGSNVVIAGSGNTSVTAGAGNETFTVATASGNVTLTGSSSGADSFNFASTGATASTSVEVVANFTSADSVNLVGYGASGYTANVVNGSTVLTLSDGSQVVFAGVSDQNAVLSKLHSA